MMLFRDERSCCASEHRISGGTRFDSEIRIAKPRGLSVARRLRRLGIVWHSILSALAWLSPRHALTRFRNTAQRTLMLRFCGLGKIFLGLGLLSAAQPVWASFTLLANGVVTQLPTGISTIDTLSGAAIDFSGNLYVADTSSNQIVKIASDGVTTSVLSITGLGTALSSPRGLVIDGSGNLYVADTGNNRIVEISPALAGSVISTSSITLNAPQGVAVDVAGDIFISDTGNSQIVKIPSGGTAAVFTITGLSPVLSNQRGIAVDPLGNLYIADTGNSRVVKVSSTGAAGAPLTTARGTALDGPSGVAVGNNGVLYIADTNTTENGNPTPGRVVIVDSQGNASELLTGYPVFNSPLAVAVSTMGNLYVLDNGGTANAGRVQSFQSITIDESDSFTSSVGFGHLQLGGAGTSITIPFDVGSGITLASINIYTAGTQNLDFTIANDSTCVTGSIYASNTDCTVDVTFSPTAAGLRRGALVLNYGEGSLTVPIFGVADAPVAALSPAVASVLNIGSATLGSPFQTAVDGAGNIYVTNYGGNTVVKIPAGGGSGTTVSTGSFPLSQPTGVAVDASGNLFIADYGNNRIIEVATNGTASIFSISGLSQAINEPTALAFDGAGNLYITDYYNGRMVEVNPYGQGTVLATGSITFAATTITGTAVDTVGNVYIADRTNNRIVKVDPLGNASLVSHTSVGALSNPEGVAVDPSDNVYIMDSSNLRIIRITTSGAIAVMPFSSVTIGSFIFGITLDANGNVLVADWSNNRLVKVNVGQSSLAYANTGVGSTSSDSPKTATVTDLGDQPLVFSAIAGYTSNFPENTSDDNLCAASTSLAAGALCDISVEFTPQSGGSLSSSVVVTNNNLNVSATTESVAVSGTGLITADTTAVSAAASPTSAAIGQPLSIIVTVSDTTTGHTATVPTGSVTFIDTVGSTAVSLNGGNPVTLSGGVATLNGVTLSGAGTHTISVNYGGVTNSFLASTNSITVIVTLDTETITGPATQPVQIPIGQTGLVTITVAGPYGATAPPSGSVSYNILNSSNTSVASGSVPLTTGLSSSTATVSVPSSLPPGTYTVTVSYGGDGNYAASSAPITVSFTVGKAAVTVALSSSANPVLEKNGVTFTATVSSGGGTPDGSVGFYDGTTLLGSGTLAAGVATYSTSSLGTGAHSITAQYSGSSNFAALTSSVLTETVEDFSLNVATSGTTSATVTPGGTASYALVFGPTTGTTFPAAVTLSVTGLPPGATATLTPNTLPAGAGATNVSLTVHVSSLTASLSLRHKNDLALKLSPAMLGMLLLPFGGRIRRSAGKRGRLAFLLSLTFLGGALVGLTGCGTQSSGFLGTPQTSYTLTVTATSGALSHSTTLNLTVE